MGVIDMWLLFVSLLLILWHDCNQDVVIFCYRIGLGAFMTVRTRALVPITATLGLTWLNSACSNRFATFSTRFMTSKD
jgi:hypothetical protein